MRHNSGEVNYLLGDHLGFTALTLTSTGARLATNTELRYYAYGAPRYTAGATPTTFNYTGQRKDSASGLLFYNARWYDPVIGRFLAADTIVPEPGNPQALNRYAYANNSPIVYNDPSGHCSTCIGAAVGGIAGGALYLWNESRHGGFNWREDWRDLLVASGEGALAGALIATPGGQAAGISMAANLIGDHVENLALDEDFSAAEHLVTGMSGAVEGAVGAHAVGRVSKFAKTVGVVGENFSAVRAATAAGNAAVWGAAEGGTLAALNGESVRSGAVNGAIQNGITELISFGNVEQVRLSGAITTIGEERFVELAHNTLPDSAITFGRWVLQGANRQQAIIDTSQRPRSGR